MNWKRILWNFCKWLLKLCRKLLLFALWAACELLAVLFAALAKYLKTKITS